MIEIDLQSGRGARFHPPRAIPKAANPAQQILAWIEPFSLRRSFKPVELFPPRSTAGSHTQESLHPRQPAPDEVDF